LLKERVQVAPNLGMSLKNPGNAARLTLGLPTPDLPAQPGPACYRFSRTSLGRRPCRTLRRGRLLVQAGRQPCSSARHFALPFPFASFPLRSPLEPETHHPGALPRRRSLKALGEGQAWHPGGRWGVARLEGPSLAPAAPSGRPAEGIPSARPPWYGPGPTPPPPQTLPPPLTLLIRIFLSRAKSRPARLNCRPRRVRLLFGGLCFFLRSPLDVIEPPYVGERRNFCCLFR